MVVQPVPSFKLLRLARFVNDWQQSLSPEARASYEKALALTQQEPRAAIPARVVEELK
jgi:hypothetical protein